MDEKDGTPPRHALGAGAERVTRICNTRLSNISILYRTLEFDSGILDAGCLAEQRLPETRDYVISVHAQIISLSAKITLCS